MLGSTLLLLLLLLAVASPWIGYRLRGSGTANLLVVDKTVPYLNYREHELLHWHLNHNKLFRPDGGRWDAEEDYVGFDPTVCEGRDIEPAMLDDIDLLYVADSFGVYHEDYRVYPDAGVDCSAKVLAEAEPEPGDGPFDAPEPSGVIFGGLDAEEVDVIEGFRDSGGSMVVEFNSLATPTYPGPESFRLGDMVGVAYRGWLGRWFVDLGAEVEIQDRLKEKYQRVTGEVWTFTGPGLVVFHEIEERMVVITEDQFSSREVVTLEVDLPDDPIGREITDGTPYWYWFAAVEVDPAATVVASFQLHLEPEAEAMMAEQGFDTRLPAIVYRTFDPFAGYLAGDFSDLGTRTPGWLSTIWLDGIRSWLAKGSAVGDPDDFLWNVVFPLWDVVFEASGVVSG